jgi:hypothetical protein
MQSLRPYACAFNWRTLLILLRLCLWERVGLLDVDLLKDLAVDHVMWPLIDKLLV